MSSRKQQEAAAKKQVYEKAARAKILGNLKRNGIVANNKAEGSILVFSTDISGRQGIHSALSPAYPCQGMSDPESVRRGMACGTVVMVSPSLRPVGRSHRKPPGNQFSNSGHC